MSPRIHSRARAQRLALTVPGTSTRSAAQGPPDGLFPLLPDGWAVHRRARGSLGRHHPPAARPAVPLLRRRAVFDLDPRSRVVARIPVTVGRQGLHPVVVFFPVLTDALFSIGIFLRPSRSTSPSIGQALHSGNIRLGPFPFSSSISFFFPFHDQSPGHGSIAATVVVAPAPSLLARLRRHAHLLEGMRRHLPVHLLGTSSLTFCTLLLFEGGGLGLERVFFRPRLFGRKVLGTRFRRLY